MYKMKEEMYIKYKKWGDVRKLAHETGYSENYISQILNGREFDRKMLAYIITKMYSKELEIADVFNVF